MERREQHKDPGEHAANIERMLRDVRDHLGRDVARVDDPRARALFETAREVINGLMTAFEHFRHDKDAWRSGEAHEPA